MTFVCLWHFCLNGPFLKKEIILKIVFYDCIGIRKNIIQTELCSFFILIEAEVKTSLWFLGSVPPGLKPTLMEPP